MGYDIMLYCVKEVESEKGVYREIKDAPVFSWRGRQVAEIVTILDTEIRTKIGFRFDWTIDDRSTEDSLFTDGECEIEGYIEPRHLYDAVSMCESIKNLMTYAELHLNELPKYYHLHLESSKLEIPSYVANAHDAWGIFEEEPWYFKSGWFHCKSYKSEESPLDWHSNQEPEDRAKIRYLKASSFDLLLFSPFRNGPLEDELMITMKRFENGEKPDHLSIIEKTYFDYFKSPFQQILEVCEFAIQNHAKIFVLHSH